VSAAAPNSIHVTSAVNANSTYLTNNGAVFYLKGTYSNSGNGSISFGTVKTISACGRTCQRSGGGRAYGDIYVNQANENNLMVGGVDFLSVS